MKKIILIFKNPVKDGRLEIAGGVLDCERFFSLQDAPYRLEVTVSDEMVDVGALATIITVRIGKSGFSFFLRDVNQKHPIYISQNGVIVTQSGDTRSYEEIVDAIKSNNGQSELEKIASEPEESYENAIKGLRKLECPTWLGISRDIRFFEVGTRGYLDEQFDSITPKNFFRGVYTEGTGKEAIKYHFISGRGIGPERNVVRRLQDGILPILNSTETDGCISYNTQYFTTYEHTPLDEKHLEGTDMYVADSYGAFATFTDEQSKIVEIHKKEFDAQDEETVMYIRVTATNNGNVPCYAFFKLPDPLPMREYYKPDFEPPHYDGDKGFGLMPNGTVYLVATVDGKPIPQDEFSAMVAPNESVVCVYKIPHSPIDEQRAVQLVKEDYGKRLAQAEEFWHSKLSNIADISLPESRIEEMMKAGLLHIETGYFGKKDEPVVPIVGVYTAIGSESSPAIQYLDAMGNNSLAERALEFFCVKQRENGDMRNFNDYELEPGFVVWSMAEHYRMTRDNLWAAHIAPCVKKACSYLEDWRNKNLTEELKGKGYGMLAGKVADPDDLFHSFMLNAGAYAAFAGASEILANVEPETAKYYKNLAAKFRLDIRESLIENIILSPVIPTGNGKWISTFSPWTEYRGPLMLYANGGRCFTHGAFTIRETVGAQYLVLLGVIDADEPLAGLIAENFAELLNVRNVSFSQPYYSPHPFINLKRGDVKAFLKEFYNGFAALADRETYSFWEHFYHVSPHKLHEEAWFLIRCRWMLFLEDGDTLKLLSGIPRAWLQHGKNIRINGVKTYFGVLYLNVVSDLNEGIIHVSVKLDGNNNLNKLVVRLPNPIEGVTAISSTKGKYDETIESVVFDNFDGKVEFELKFPK